MSRSHEHAEGSISYQVLPVAKLSDDRLRNMHGVLWAAFAKVLSGQRTTDDIDFLTSAHNFGRFRRSRLMPATAFPEQSFRDARAALAIVDLGRQRRVAGYLLSAENASGPAESVRQLKLKTGYKRYLHMRELAVAPLYQKQGVATRLLYETLRQHDDTEQVTAYSWESELGYMPPLFRALTMEMTGEKPVELYGPDIAPVNQQRWLGQVGAMRSVVAARLPQSAE